MMENRTVIYSGRVQGVGFRFTVSNIAERFSVTGYVRNMVNGTVELVCEGAASELDAFLDTIQRERAQYIREFTVELDHATGEFNDFQVKR